jgi:hypothetical protein
MLSRGSGIAHENIYLQQQVARTSAFEVYTSYPIKGGLVTKLQGGGP